ncbi:MAG: hypothetical protein IMZ65_03235, partial [Planctomycetes bacterium]|nr:hypothetical protein [Planctomycetota bacterium]
EGLQTTDGLSVRGALVPVSASRFVTANGNATWDFTGGASAQRTDAFGAVERFERIAPAAPTATGLAPLVGRYESDEAEVVMDVAAEGGVLVLKRRPDSVVTLTPVYADAFRGSIGLVRFHRDPAGAVKGLSVMVDRVWDLRFKRQ